MSSFTSEITQTCSRCAQPLPPGALACPQCKALVHADEMERAAAQARSLEAGGRLQEAHQQWLSILPLLPPESKQAEWIREHVRELELAAANAHRPTQPDSKKKWAKRLGPLAPLAVVLAKIKTVLFAIFKLKFLFSFVAFIGLYWAAWGPKFGIGFAILILIHELGHFVEIKRRGLPAEMPVFLPGLGAYVRWNAMGVTQETRAAISMAGPLAGFLSAAACGVVGFETGDPVWLALARTGAWLNILNLIPIWVLDGAGAIVPLNMTERLLVMLVSAGLGYATSESVFYFVGAGVLLNILLAAFERRPAAQPGTIRLNLNASGQAVQGASYAAPEAQRQSGSPLITAYFIAVLTALGAVLYMLPGHGSGIP
ncbi:MAG TPA: site-2 protease family protein [Candidatus Angelobacter sp.]|nr:site-2 protease family protein [Candidatus Angelobacter sp.]